MQTTHIYHGKTDQKKAGVAILILDIEVFKVNNQG